MSFFWDTSKEEETSVSHLVLEKAVLQGFVARVAAGALEQQLVLLAVESDVTKWPSVF